jgi:hypothetical protein
MVLAGITSSANFPVVSGVQAALSVSPDGFIMEVAYIAIAGVPAANSVLPSSGSGTSQTFALQYSDTGGAASLTQVWVYFNATLANPASNACMLYYNTATNQIYLLNDNVTVFQPATLGAASTLQNSQCSVNVAASTVTLSGNTLTLNLAMTFKPAYAGAKNIYMHAIDISGSNSGWQPLGTWTVAGTGDTVPAGPITSLGAEFVQCQAKVGKTVTELRCFAPDSDPKVIGHFEK